MFVILGLDASSMLVQPDVQTCFKLRRSDKLQPKNPGSPAIFNSLFPCPRVSVDPHWCSYLHLCHHSVNEFQYAPINPSLEFANTLSTTDEQRTTMTQTIIPDEDDVRDFVQDYSDIKRLTPSRANDLLDKIMADTQPEEPDADVSSEPGGR